MIAAFTGLIAGIIHVWSGPDHLAAIAPLAAQRRQSGTSANSKTPSDRTDCRNSWLPGARWGLGHSAGVAVIGLLALLLRDRLPLDRLSAWGERMVGVMLVAIGAWALRKAFHVHAHEHEHDGGRHVHLHAHTHKLPHESTGAHSHHSHAAFGIGMLHGLAGSSHLFGILPMLLLATRIERLSYLAAFSLGTIVSMASFSYGIGWLAARRRMGSARAYRALMTACAAVAMGVGCFWLVGGAK